MEFHFDKDDAIKYGVEAAVLLYNLKFWIKKNKANGKNFIDGHYWTYNSREAFEKLFPFWDLRKIGRILLELENIGVIMSANYNKSKWDKTKWYCLVDESFMSDIEDESSSAFFEEDFFEKDNNETKKCLSIDKKLPIDGQKVVDVYKTYNKTNIKKPNNNTILPTAKSEEFALESFKEVSIQEAEKARKKALVTARNAVFSHFCELYSNLSGGRQYLPKKSEFVLLTRLLKTYTAEEIKEKIGWLYVGCAKGLFWFAKNIGDFTLGKLYSQWNNILPQLTEEQKREAQRQKEDEELRRRVMANVRDAQSAKR